MDLVSIVTLVQTIIPALIGPGAAIIICCAMLGFIGYITVKHLLPSIEARFKEAQDNTNRLMEEHKADRETFQCAIEALTTGQTTISTKMESIIVEVKDLTTKVDTIGDRIERLDDDMDDHLRDCKQN